MKKNIVSLFAAFMVATLVTGCAQKVQVKALNPAEVGEMAAKKMAEAQYGKGCVKNIRRKR